jgi:Ca2+-binding RTX toxin-like protein
MRIGRYDVPVIRRTPRFAWRPGAWLCGALILAAVTSVAVPAAADTSHAGWPPDQHLMMDKGPAGGAVTLQGAADKHNYLLGGDGNDTITGGPMGDVIWGDYRPTVQPTNQLDIIHAGNGPNYIYTSHGTNDVWTGTSPNTIVHAHFGQGTIYCGSPAQLVDSTRKSGYTLVGCSNVNR